MNKKKIVTFLLVVFIYFIYTFYGEELGLVEEVVNNQNKVLDSEVINVSSSDKFQIRYLDVGQADSILICNNGEYMLIDAGNNVDGEKLVNYFKDLGISEFKYVIATHAHEDHIGGIDDVLNNFKVEKFFMPDVLTTTKTFEDVIDALEVNNMFYDVPSIGDEFDFVNSKFKVLSILNEEDDLNDTSIVLRLVYGDTSFLFMGDASSKIENNIINNGFDIRSDVLKVGHHGSEYSSMLSFLNKVKPKYSIISVGNDNSYGHPHSKALNNLKKVNSMVYRTDKDGTIIVESDGVNLDVSFSKTNLDG